MTERRLAAILVADVVGYSMLVGSDEAGTLAKLESLRKDVIESAIAKHAGRLFKSVGDGFLVEFASAVQAVAAARAIQQANADGALPLRIGIHVGDVVVQGDDLMGDGVNIAARIEGIANAGGIAMSRAVHEQVRDKLDLGFEDKGEIALKNLAHPVHVFSITGTKPTVATAPALTLPDRPSIAVLPFQNISGEPEQDYFVDGIVEDIITSLSRFKWLFVAARNSTFVYKGRPVDIRQVSRELGVRYVLEGSLRKTANRVRITGQLIEAASGMHVWADRYDRTLDDIFEVQDELTLKVVSAIEPNLRQAEIERAKRKRPDSLDAYDLYLRALPRVHVYMPEEVDQALALLQRALELQPDYPAAHAAMAWCYEVRYLRGGLHEADKLAALRHAHGAIEAGADDAGTLASAGFVIGLVAHDYDSAMDAIDRALSLTPASALALALGATVLAHAGDTRRAIDYAERALRLAPFGREAVNPHLALSMAYCAAGNFAAAAAAATKAVLLNPRFSVPHVMNAAALASDGRLAEAREAARHVLELEPQFSVTMFVRAHTGRPEIWQPVGEALRKAGLPE